MLVKSRLKLPNSKHQHPEKHQASNPKTNGAFHVWNLGDWSFSGAWMLVLGASFWNASRPRSVVAVFDRINSTHRFLAGLLFDDMRHQPGSSRDHENAVERRRIHS